MSSNMNLTEIEFLIIEGTKVQFTYFQLDMLSVAETWDDYGLLKAPELYGILRRQKYNIMNINCSWYGGYVFLELTYYNQNWQFGVGPEYFKVSTEQMEQLLSYYCSYDKPEKVNWLIEGF